MDCRTGEIMSEAEALRRIKQDAAAAAYLEPMNLAPTQKQMKRNPTKVGRNESCPCGSGLKFKRCCYAIRKAKGMGLR